MIRKTSHARYDLWYHIAWSTKYRKKIFTDKRMVQSTKELFREVAMHYDIEPKGVEVLPDHIHLLVSAPPRIAPSQVVQILKSVSTKRLFEKYKWLEGKYWGGEIWAGGYFVRSVGERITKAAIEKYLKAQTAES